MRGDGETCIRRPELHLAVAVYHTCRQGHNDNISDIRRIAVITHQSSQTILYIRHQTRREPPCAIRNKNVVSESQISSLFELYDHDTRDVWSGVLAGALPGPRCQQMSALYLPNLR
ncbi:hypothetical protein J6590_026953 [Homalodisca vitripennis]|nr:hypothetical protein J6590_026953 [Homalodisca vitripennis]